MIRNLADKIRPTLIDEIQHINESFPKKLQSSLILYGPPGSGKTTYAKAMIKSANIPHFSLTAVETGTQSFKDIFQKATPSEPIIIASFKLRSMSPTGYLLATYRKRKHYSDRNNTRKSFVYIKASVVVKVSSSHFSAA